MQVLLPTLAPGLADAAVQVDLPGEQVDVVDALCPDRDYQQYQAENANPSYYCNRPSPNADIPQLHGFIDAVSHHRHEEEKKRAKERAEDLQKFTNMLNSII